MRPKLVTANRNKFVATLDVASEIVDFYGRAVRGG